MKKAVIYARYSCSGQTEQSIEGQLRVCREYARGNELLIMGEYIDRAMTGKTDARPNFQRMIKDSKNGNWNYVIVYKLDRFSRDKYETASYKHELKKNGVKLVSAMENIPDTPEGIILESVIEGMNEYYSKELAQKVKRGMRETRLKGYFQGGKVLYGYKIEGRKIVVDEEKAEVVKYIFSEYAKGMYVRQIIENLHSKGIYKNGKPFADNRLFDMIKNECYIGKYTKDGEVFENMYPRIIDDETFNKCKARRRQNKSGKQSVKSVYLLRNKIICGYCGKPICAESGTTRFGKKINYYKCSGIKKYRNGCIKETVRQNILEDFVLKELIKVLNNPKNIDLVISKLMKLQEEDCVNTELNILIKTKKQAENALENIANAIEIGVVNKTTQSRMLKLEQQIDDIERQILIEKSKTNVKITEDEIRKYYSEALLQEPFIVIQYLVKQIVMYNDKIEITLNNPTNKSPDDEDSFLFARKKQLPKVIQNVAEPRMIEILINYYL